MGSQPYRSPLAPGRDARSRDRGDRDLVPAFALLWVLSLMYVARVLLHHEAFGAQSTMALLSILAIPWLAWDRRARPRERANREALQRVHVQAAYAAAEHGDVDLAITHCRTVLDGSVDAAIRRDAVRLLAYAFATRGDWTGLVALLEAGGALALDSTDLENYERVARELGQAHEAQRIALVARGAAGGERL